MNSVIQTTKECFICKKTENLHSHHCFYGPNRKWSEYYGLKIWLCPDHHNMSDAGVHFNKALDHEIKQIAQREFEDTYGHDAFLKIFGRNYLD